MLVTSSDSIWPLKHIRFDPGSLPGSVIGHSSGKCTAARLRIMFLKCVFLHDQLLDAHGCI